MNPSSALVNRIWRLCTLLRKDGVTYQQYVNEITYLIFLKMMQERGLEDRLPVACRWSRLLQPGGDLLGAYKEILKGLRSAPSAEGNLAIVFSDATTIVRDENNLRALIEAIDELPWYDNGRDNFGDIYEGILERNAEESKRGAGQYFTPRVVVDAVVTAMRPQPGETVQDPAAGTGGFLIGADEYVRRQSSDSIGSRMRPRPKPLRFVAMENVPDTYRLLLMNLTLHEVDTGEIYLGDTLSKDHLKLQAADLVLSNPPFGPAGGRPTRDDLEFTAAVSNFQLPFVEHCLKALKPGGRAAIVVPDNVLFEDGRARDLRRYMLDEFHLHTLLRLPAGIFYAAGVKTNVLFIAKPLHQEDRRTWVYDLRSNMPTFGKSAPLRDAALAEFLAFYGERSDGSDRKGLAANATGARFREFGREDLASRDDDLDIVWLKDAGTSPEDDLTDPAAIAAAMSSHLRLAITTLDEIAATLKQTEAAERDD
ncbi:N-6 DNA methylase [Caulobacter sp. CCG-8]|uniref:class I SAM-dependent DNA methyltransferase n=1 Tax=Caulobacter sp. CCG-8 TaxID=3127958 RepID=UPI00307E4D2E